MTEPNDSVNSGSGKRPERDVRSSAVPPAVPNEVAADSSWRAAFIILNSPAFVGRSEVWKHVDLKRCSIFFPQILDIPYWSNSERHLLEIAASLFNHDLDVNLYRIFNYLDDQQAMLAIRAIAELARIPVSQGGAYGFDRSPRSTADERTTPPNLADQPPFNIKEKSNDV